MGDKRPIPASGWPAVPDQDGGGNYLERMYSASTDPRDEEEDIILSVLQNLSEGADVQKDAMLEYHEGRLEPGDKSGRARRLREDLAYRDKVNPRIIPQDDY